MPRKAGSTTTVTKTTEEVKEESVNLNEVLSLLKNIKEENDKLREEVTRLKTQDKSCESEETNSLNRLVETIANSRDNKTVTIVHAQEMFGGLCTFIHLSNLDISFSHVGETRVLTCQQFEELCSKYRSFIDEGIIKVSPKNGDLCEGYHIQCYEDTTSKKHLTPEILSELPNMSDEKLKEIYSDLSESDQRVMLNYWLGQCYARPEERDSRFYNRYKLEYLNNLSKSDIFGNIIADMNHI